MLFRSTLEIEEAAAVDFPQGLPGFESSRRFALLAEPELSPVVCLQSLDSPDFSLWAAPVAAIDPAYSLELSQEDARVLGLDAHGLTAAARDILCLAILCAPENGPPTANLLAPVVVNLKTSVAVQAVRSDSRYSHRHVLAAGDEQCRAGAAASDPGKDRDSAAPESVVPLSSGDIACL